MHIQVELILLTLSLLFLISIVVSKAGGRFGVPVLLMFLFVGMLFGQDGFGIHFDNLVLAQAVSTFALCIILFSGGLDTQIKDIRPIIKEGTILSTLGVLMTAGLTGVFIWLLAGILMPGIQLSFMESLLLASIMSSTDSASVFALLRSKGLGLKNNLKPLLELESGSNDPMAYLLTVTLIEAILMGRTSPGDLALSLLLQIIIGAVAGLLLGRLAVKITNKINLPNEALYPVLLFACCVFIFSITYFIKGNGYLAVYIGGLVVGNSRFITKRSTVKFFDVFAWMSQIVMFLTLGLLVVPSELPSIAVPAIAISLFLIFVGRPLTVFACLIPFKTGFIDKLFVSWVGLRGAVPIVFAILPMAAGVPHAREMFNIVFFITLISLSVQGGTLSFVAKRLKLSDDDAAKDANDFELEFSEEIKSAMTEFTLTEKNLNKGPNLISMALPDKTLAVMVKRGRKYFIPKGNTELQIGDKLLVITDDETALVETCKALGIERYSVKKNA